MQMVFRKFLGRSDLPETQALTIHESSEIVEVGEDKHFKFAAFQVITLSLKGFK